MKIIADNKIPFIQGRLEKFGETLYLAPSEIRAGVVKDADILIVRTRTQCNEKLLGVSNVKLVVTATIGTDHIDLEWCRRSGITVRNCAGCNAPGVAQYVWAALANMDFDPEKHVLGIVGCGNVGSIVADWGGKLGVETMVCDPPKAMGNGECGYVGLEEMLGRCDAVTLHVPLTTEGKWKTFHMFGPSELSMMKPGGLLVNTSRGPVVDNAAWAQAIACGQVRGVADVWEDEPRLSLPLLELVGIATPHIAGYSFQGKQRAARMALEAVAGFCGGEAEINGLEGPYTPPVSIPSLSDVAGSYDIMADDSLLRAHPHDFEKLRSNYNYRKEY